MTHSIMNMEPMVLVAIDIAKARNDVLVALPDGSRRKFIVAKKLEDYQKFASDLMSLNEPCLMGFEATCNYHRLAYYLEKEGFSLRLVSSLAPAKTREALYNSWDKNDPKDARVMLHTMKTGVSQTYCDPMSRSTNEIRVLSETYYQAYLHKMKVQHSMMTHYLPLYFPEAQKYFHSSRAEWFSSFLLRFTVPAVALKYTNKRGVHFNCM